MSKALVVDDSRAVRMILAKTLGEMGFPVVQAGNGREALDVLVREHGLVQLALVDWNMPEMTGIEFVRRVRADRAYDHVTLIMVTTETEMEQMSAAIEAGANEYVMKPFTRDALESKLRLLGAVA
jgi:two-component system chemotaxis response regulator CheY